MTLRAPRVPLSLDPLIAEAKRRMRRRRVLVAAVLLLVAALAIAAVIASRSPGGPQSAVPPGGQQAQHPGAGGGSSGVQAIAHKWAKYFGDPHATVARFETVQIERSRWTMIQMKGRSFRAGCPSPSPTGFQSCRARYLELGVKLNAHDATMYWGLTSSQVAAVTQARKANQRFRIFPDFMGIAVRCAIPRGGPQGGTLPGTCSTNAGPANHVKTRRVEFTETWGGSNEAGWVVTLDRGGGVHSIRVTGQPPQLWK
jgi:hypothetical protein